MYPIDYNAGYSYGTGIHVTNTGISQFFQRYLRHKLESVFVWNMPEQWLRFDGRDYFLRILYHRGYIAIFNTDKFGVIPQECALAGHGVFHQPTEILVANHLFSAPQRAKIGTECALIKLQPDYRGVDDKIAYYGDMMALCAQTAAGNIFNSKLSYVFAAGNKNIAKSFDTMYQDIASGKPAVVVDQQLFRGDGSPAWQAFEQNVGQNYIAGDIFDDLRKLERAFCTDFGIPNANTEKKERLVSDEVNANDVETKTWCDMAIDTLNVGIAEANRLFPDINLSVRWRYEEGGKTNGSGNTGSDADN